MKGKDKIVTLILSTFILGSFLLILFKPAEAFSDSERRRLKQFPEISLEGVLSGRVMEEFESYVLDQFIFRDFFRSLKAVCVYNVFGQRDNEGMYLAEGHISRMEYPLNEESVNRNFKNWYDIYDTYLKMTEVNIYFSIIPDKNYYLAEKNGYLAIDYEKIFELAEKKASFAKYIDITGQLEADDYYKTDPHWRQEKITDVAETIANQMGISLTAEYEERTFQKPFYGVYNKQLALPFYGEEFKYLSNDMLEDVVVYDYENDKNIFVYDMEKADGKDSYEMFLSGSLPLLTIENPNASTEKELIVFRDSFGSSIAPLWAEGYQKITLVDTRYLHPKQLGEWIDFRNQDVLFLYSTLSLNQG